MADHLGPDILVQLGTLLCGLPMLCLSSIDSVLEHSHLIEHLRVLPEILFTFSAALNQEFLQPFVAVQLNGIDWSELLVSAGL
jgi:hypothetical protein